MLGDLYSPSVGVQNSDNISKNSQISEEYEQPNRGIGLFICQKILQHFGGRLHFISDINQGSIFSFKFEMRNATMNNASFYTQNYDRNSNISKSPSNVFTPRIN